MSLTMSLQVTAMVLHLLLLPGKGLYGTRGAETLRDHGIAEMIRDGTLYTAFQCSSYQNQLHAQLYGQSWHR